MQRNSFFQQNIKNTWTKKPKIVKRTFFIKITKANEMFNSVKIFQPSVGLRKKKKLCFHNKDVITKKDLRRIKEGPKMVEIDALTQKLVGLYLLGLTTLEVTVESRFPQNVSQCKSLWTLLASEVSVTLYRKENNNWVKRWRVEGSRQRSADRSDNQYGTVIKKVPKIAVK